MEDYVLVEADIDLVRNITRVIDYTQTPNWIFDYDLQYVSTLSNVARIIYFKMYQRLRLSVKNGWERDGRPYIAMSRKELEDIGVATRKTLSEAIDQLKRIKLLEEFNLPNNKRGFFVNIIVNAKQYDDFVEDA